MSVQLKEMSSAEIFEGKNAARAEHLLMASGRILFKRLENGPSHVFKALNASLSLNLEG